MIIYDYCLSVNFLFFFVLAMGQPIIQNNLSQMPTWLILILSQHLIQLTG